MMGRAIISILFFLIGANVTSAQTVSIADPNLRQAIEAALDKTSGAPITEAEMDSLIELRAPNADISDLTGLETAVNLQRLYLGREYVSAEGRFINNNSISDLTPLAGLTQLTVLDLNGNGSVVRSVNVGYQVAGIYESRSKAVYWDGRNEFGEAVASGMFFYHLSAGDYSATRKMLIIK